MLSISQLEPLEARINLVAKAALVESLLLPFARFE
jgi:hypothetical protein